MRIIELKLLKFNELSDEAKQTAIENYRNKGYEPAWTEENRQTLEAFEEVFPIQISKWSYGGRGEGVIYSIVGDHIEDVSGQRLATYLWNNYRRDLFKGKYYGHLSESDKHGNKIPVSKEHPIGKRHVKRYSKIILDTTCVLTGYYMDDVILKPIYEFLERPIKGVTFSDLLDDCFDAWIKGCNDDIEHQNSDEYIAEHLEANDYEFTSDGNTYP